MGVEAKATRAVLDAMYTYTAGNNKREEDGTYRIRIGLIGHSKDLIVKGDTLQQKGREILFSDLDYAEHCWSSGIIKLYKKGGEKFCSFDDMRSNRTLLVDDLRGHGVPIKENRQMFSKKDNSKCL